MRVKLLSNEYHERLLGYSPKPLSPIRLRDAESEYKRFGVDSLVDRCQPVELPLPDWLPTVDRFFQDAADFAIAPWLQQLQTLLTSGLPQLPDKTVMPVVKGWWRLQNGQVDKVDGLPSGAYFFDIETHQKGDRWLPTCAVAASTDAWFIWVWDKENPTTTIEGVEGCLLIGWNVQYDRAYVASEYLMKDSGNRWLDLMSCWQAVRGYGNQQRGAVSMAYGVHVGDADEEVLDEEALDTSSQDKQWKPGSPQWTKETHVSRSLDAVHSFYRLGALDKGVREAIVAGGEQYAQLAIWDIVYYCCSDVLGTYRVFTKLWPEYREAHPHDVSIAGHILLGSAWLPLSPDRFPGYYERAEAATNEVENDIDRQLADLADRTVERYYERLVQLADDINAVKRPKKADPDYKAKNEAVERQREEILQAFVATLPKSLQSLDWLPSTVGKTKGHPAWYRGTKKFTLSQRRSTALLGVRWLGEEVYWDEEVKGYRTDSGIIPRPDDAEKAATLLFAKGFVAATEDGVLTSEHGSDLLKRKVSTINWISLRKRVAALQTESPEGYPVTLPQLLVTGTITRRAADKVWQVASNPKAKRIGTELKSMIEAPPGYKIVGFDFDSQELKLAAFLGDALQGGLASTALTLMILCGDKANKSDFMSVTANQSGLSRDSAKSLVYGGIYGLGLTGAITGLLKSIPGLTREEAAKLAKQFFDAFKGRREGDRFVGGLASAFFNAAGERVRSATQRSPILNASLSIPIAAAKDSYAPTVLNWVVQTSGVDCRDMTIAAVNYLFHRFDIDGRLLLTIHDEIRTIVADADVVKAVYVLQLAHTLVWAYVMDVFGLGALPAAGAWASGVDVDTVVRKEPTDPCITPTQAALPLGECWDIKELMRRLPQETQLFDNSRP